MKALSFEGSGVEYFKIWIVNILLNIVTLGLYYPWAKVRNNRYFYGNSTLEGRNFEYHATGKQLFIGYLIAMVLLIIYVVIQQVSPTGGTIVALIFMLALPWIIWRSLKFNMRITSYSNVRFGFVGKLLDSYLNFLVLPIILMAIIYGGITAGIMMMLGFAGGSLLIGIIILFVALVLGIIAGSYMKKRNTSYILNGTRYGQGEFITKLETKRFLKIILKVIGLSLLIFVAIYAVIGALLYLTIGMEGLKEIMEMKGDPRAIQEAVVDYTPHMVKHLRNPAEDISLLMVEDNGLTLQFVRNQTEKICLAAVKNNGEALQYVHNQSVEICGAALKQTKKAIPFINASIFTNLNLKQEERDSLSNISDINKIEEVL